MAVAKMTQDDTNFQSQDFQNYKNKCKKITRKIDKWHKELETKKQTSFQNDSEFVFLNESPSNFSNSDSDGDDDI
jgi:hypothetical protein